MHKLVCTNRKEGPAAPRKTSRGLPTTSRRPLCCFSKSAFFPKRQAASKPLGNTTKLQVCVPEVLVAREVLKSILELWKDQGEYQKASAFYEKGGFFANAAECHHVCGNHEQAVEVLRRGEQFDELITYIAQYV